jgi:hypothetical protein
MTLKYLLISNMNDMPVSVVHYPILKFQKRPKTAYPIIHSTGPSCAHCGSKRVARGKYLCRGCRALYMRDWRRKHKVKVNL